jgi:mannose-6-phosphate isomerase-like protein (cupin superfamily)
MTQGRTYVAGLVTGVAVTGAIMVAASTPFTTLAQDAMPKPGVKVLLENEQVRVREVTFTPGSGDTHTHQWAHVGVILTKGQLAFADAGKAEEIVDFEAGSAGFREAKVTHLARNPGKTTMKVIEVEVK